LALQLKVELAVQQLETAANSVGHLVLAVPQPLWQLDTSGGPAEQPAAVTAGQTSMQSAGTPVRQEMSAAFAVSQPLG
jgi:hypothetical protein